MIRRIRRLLRIAGFGVFVAAVAKEMAKPEKERTWHGKVGFVPYDFNPPTWERLQAAYWNPDDDRLFTERVFGVGWAVNFFQARRLMLGVYGSLMGVKLPASQRWKERTGRARTAKAVKPAKPAGAAADR